MFITPEVELPDQLLSALEEGRLVVFAGAGVSMGSPSNLPDFKQLAAWVVGSSVSPLDPESLDQFLGRAEANGVDVQGRTRLRLTVPASRPTVLHEELIGLFGSPERIRIVTTNFDHHFGTVIANQYASGTVPIYSAPAFPLGRDARGLIHLHGSLAVRHHPLVLTDADFGRAYLTEGWATRFLVELFAHNTVCFVGYSHDDQPMSYLARSLVPGTARFVLTPPGAEDRWRRLGITPIHYPLAPTGDPHIALPSAITAWASFAKMGALDHERRIRDLVGVAPPLDRRDIDYLRHALLDDVRRVFFLRHARGLEWLKFVIEAGALEDLFEDATEEASRRASIFGDWLCDHFMLQHPIELLAFLRSHKLGVGVRLWGALAWQLSRVDPLPAAEILDSWVACLLVTRNPRWDTRPLDTLLARLVPDSCTSGMLLYSHLATPAVSVEPSWMDLDDSSGRLRLPISLSTTGEDRVLRSAWDNLLRPTLPTSHAQVGVILTESLTRAHALLAAAGVADSGWDPMSFSRSAIEPHPQDTYPRELDSIVDAARDLIDCLSVEAPASAQAWIRIWQDSTAPLLRRLAIYARCAEAARDPAGALDAVITEGWLHRSELKHEVFSFISGAYSAADESVRLEFVNRALLVPVLRAPPGTPDETETEAYERYNLLVWLSRAAPESALTTAKLAELQAAHRDFSPRPHPDLTHWSSGVHAVIPQSPRSSSELLAKSATEQVEWLLTYENQVRTGDGPNREGLLLALRDACRESFDWSWQLASELRARALDDDRGVWNAILNAWQASALETADWVRILELCGSFHRLEETYPRAVANLLEQAAKPDLGVPGVQLQLVREIAERLAARDDVTDSIGVPDGPEWLVAAMGHPAGIAATAWLQTLGTLKTESGATWTGLPPAEADRLNRILGGTTTGAQRARTILASQLHFLHSLDPVWVRDHLVQLFDWGRDEEQAGQAWDGYLQRGQWNEAVFDLLQPLLADSYSKLASTLPKRDKDLAARLAGVALYSPTDPWQGGWLKRFIAETDAATRTAWAASLGRELRRLGPPAAELAWGRWIGHYWRDRVSGMPRPLDPGEREEMLGWVFGLHPVLNEVVPLVESVPLNVSDESMFYYELGQAGLIASNPGAASRVLRHVLRNAPRLAFNCGSVSRLVAEMITVGAPGDVLLEICEAMARLGCPEAADLRSRVA